jgi:hypothetical protein
MDWVHVNPETAWKSDPSLNVPTSGVVSIRTDSPKPNSIPNPKATYTNLPKYNANKAKFQDPAYQLWLLGYKSDRRNEIVGG